MSFCQVFDLGICRGCCYFAGPEDGPLVFNNPTFQHVFIFSGTQGAKLSVEEGVEPVQISGPANKIYNLQRLIGSGELTVDLAGDYAWLALFTGSKDDRIDLEQLPRGRSTVSSGAEKQKVIAVFKGVAYANGKTIKKLHFAVVPDEASVEVEVPEGAVAVVLSKTVAD